MDGLNDKFADAEVHGCGPGCHIVPSGEQNNWDRRSNLFELLANLKSVQHGHHHIQDNEIDGSPLDDIQAFVAARCTDHRQSMFGK